MATCRNVRLLLWRNTIKRKRAWCSCLIELLTPIVIVGLFVALFQAFSLSSNPNQMYLKNEEQIPPLTGSGYRIGNSSQVIALVKGDGAGSDVDDLINQFNNTLAEWYPGFDPTQVFPVGSPLRAAIPPLPSLASVTQYWASESDLYNYCKSLNYATGAGVGVNSGVYVAIVFVSSGPQWEYKIRMNLTAVPDTSSYTDDVSISSSPSYQNLYLWPKREFRRNQNPTYPIETQQQPGFASFQLLMDRFIINSTVEAALTPQFITSQLQQVASYVIPSSLQGAVAGGLAAFVASPEFTTLLPNLTNVFRAEAQTPQAVSAMPFPTTAYTTNPFYSVTSTVFAFLFSFSFLYPASRLLRDIVSEKELKMREGMRAMGLGTGALLSSWYITYVLMVFVQSVVIAIITSNNIFKHSSGAIIFAMFFLFGLATMSCCMLISVFFSRAKTAMVIGVLLLFGSIFPYIGVSGASYSYASKMGASILPATAFALCLDRISLLENANQGVTNANVHLYSNHFSVSDGLGMLILTIFAYLILTWYLDNVIPTEYGVPRPLWFPFTAEYWLEMCPFCKRRSSVVSTPVNTLATITSAPLSSSKAVVEAPDSHMNALEEAGKVIALRNLRKEFVSSIDKTAARVAVDGVDLTMYEGQIFVLLGHNGAGKTTTASMITGLLAPTSGNISVYGKHVPEELEEVRYQIGMGVCPQHDVLYPDLTVAEHLKLFAGIKGMKADAIPAAVVDTIKTVGLTEKTNALSANLSGGQKRKLSVGIALIGGSKVVILDEPTSGMDPYSRRSTWQMLKNAREGRIMILTTHFMDEADLLGDRIAIMSNGRVACCGSPLFLKRNYGVGYQMTMLKAPGTHVDQVTELIKRHLDNAELISNVGTELAYRLPINQPELLPPMLTELDSKLDRLGIVSYGIGVTTMEEVFLRVAQDQAAKEASPAPDHTTLVADAPSRPSSSDKSNRVDVRPAVVPPSSPLLEPDADPEANRHTIQDLMKHARHDGKGMFMRHMKALLVKRYQYFKRDLKGFLFLVFIPIAVVLAIVGLVSSSPPSDPPSLLISPKYFNQQRPVPDRIPYLDYLAANPTVGPPTFNGIVEAMTLIATNNPNTLALEVGVNTSVSNTTYGFINPSEPNPTVYALEVMNEYLLNTKLFYTESKYGAYVFSGNTVASHQPLNVTTYIMLQNTTAYHAVPVFMNLMNVALLQNVSDSGHSITAHNFPMPYTKRQDILISSILSFFIALGIVIGFAFVTAFYASFLVYERENNVKHQQLISGVSINAYWISTFIWDFVLYQIPMWCSIIILKGFNITELLGNSDVTRATILLFFFFGSSSAGLTYCLTYLFKSASNAQNVVIFLNVFCMFLIMASFIMSQISTTCKYDQHLQYVYMLLPAFSAGYGFVKLAFLDILPELEANCGGSVAPGTTYGALDMEAAGVNVVYMATLSVGYFAFALLLDYLLATPWFRKLFVLTPGSVATSASAALGPDPTEDSDVAEERSRIQAGAGAGDVLTLKSLRKEYGGGKLAVKSLSFTVPIGQCFGFLGINGAGKTTTLKMLSGEILPTSGSATIAGFDILTQQLQLRRLLGYCPQFDALYDLLTVREHLELFARIKGIEEPKVNETVMSLITLMDLTQFENKRAGTLSGGNKRKLSVAIALIGEPPVVFLDEPSTGMDPVSRRKLWNIIARVASERRICSVILTTHSMEECEALCGRLGIMVDGKLQCLGSIQHLKAKFGSGFSAEFKLGDPKPVLLDSVKARLLAANGGRTSVDLLSVKELCTNVGLPQRFAELNDSGTGWAIYAFLTRAGAGGVPLDQFAEWWAEEDQAMGLAMYITHVAFPGGNLVERHGSKMFFHLPPQTTPLSVMFQKLENAKSSDQMNILEYSLSQTTLEQIFNKFAAKQEGEQGIARGMVQAAEEKGGASRDTFFAAASSSHHLTAPPPPVKQTE